MAEKDKQDPKQKQQDQGYNAVTHIIDKSILNFFIGFIVMVALVLSIFSRFLHINKFAFCPVILLIVIVAGFIYAFGFLGVVAGKSSETSYKVKTLPGIAAAWAGSFSFVFPLYFMYTILYFIQILIPTYYHQISAYVPRLINMHIYLKRTCEPHEFCLMAGNIGRILGALLDALIMGIGLAILFALINSITAIFKVSADVKPKT